MFLLLLKCTYTYDYMYPELLFSYLSSRSSSILLNLLTGWRVSNSPPDHFWINSIESLVSLNGEKPLCVAPDLPKLAQTGFTLFTSCYQTPPSNLESYLCFKFSITSSDILMSWLTCIAPRCLNPSTTRASTCSLQGCLLITPQFLYISYLQSDELEAKKQTNFIFLL